jgi:hypothetical protein
MPTVLFCLLCLGIAGCAHRPWTAPIEDEENKRAARILQSLDATTQSCEKPIDGDISISYKNPFEKKQISGYFQLLYPSSLKFIATNPFGQTLLALSIVKRRFQLINTFDRRYIKGNTYSYGILHNIPTALSLGKWNDWLRGTAHFTSGDIVDLRDDTLKRGVWITIIRKKENGQRTTEGLTRLLIDPEKSLLLSRILENSQEEIIGEISYGAWKQIGDCRQPHAVRITGLEYSTEINLRLSNIAIAEELTEKDFHLKAPASYLRQIIP